MVRLSLLVAAAGIAAGVLTVWAQVPADGVVARKLVVTNSVPYAESRSAVVVVSTDPAILIPAPGSFDDPRACGFLALFIVGGSATDTVFPLCTNWRLLGTETAPRGYRYDDRELDDSSLRSVVWKPGRLKAVLKGSGPSVLASTLVPGIGIDSLEVTLLGPSSGYCARCAPANGKDGSDGRTFLAKTATCPAPLVCFASPGGAFLD